MKVTKDNTVYDTSTAKDMYHIYAGDFGQAGGYEERLFRAKNGKHFLYCVGGPNSPYKEETITLYTEKEVNDWKKKHGIQ